MIFVFFFECRHFDQIRLKGSKILFDIFVIKAKTPKFSPKMLMWDYMASKATRCYINKSVGLEKIGKLLSFYLFQSFSLKKYGAQEPLS